MTSTLIIQDLSLDSQLGQAEMSAVRGGQGNQANGVSQSNVMASYVGNNIGNDSLFAGSGPVTMQGDTHVDQTASNASSSDNVKGLFALALPRLLG